MPRTKSPRRAPIAFLLLIAVLIVAAANRIAANAPDLVPDNLVVAGVPSFAPEKRAAFESPVPSATQPPWNLVLVNRWNPISAQAANDIELTVLSNGKSVDSRIYPDLQRMFDDMRAEGVYPIVASGYRTQEDQQRIYDEKMAEFTAQGCSAAQARALTEQWVALPGTSEHQLGLGVDINADGIHSAGYEVYDWLSANAHRYGFIHRYPDDKTEITGISNEPWHYRYVGCDAAAQIHERGICLEEYLEWIS